MSTITCLPPVAYYQINKNQRSMKPRIQEPEDPEVRGLLDNLETKVARSQEWEAAFLLTFGQRAFEEAYPCIDWSTPRSTWEGDASRFASAFILADGFVASAMHRLHPFQYREMIPALTHALMAWCWRLEKNIPYFFSEDDAVKILSQTGYENMADWLKEQK